MINARFLAAPPSEADESDAPASSSRKYFVRSPDPLSNRCTRFGRRVDSASSPSLSLPPPRPPAPSLA